MENGLIGVIGAAVQSRVTWEVNPGLESVPTLNLLMGEQLALDPQLNQRHV